MRDILEAVANGDLSPSQAEVELRGYVSTEAGRFDAARRTRTGIPEAILAEGKTPDETASLTLGAIETTGRALVTRVDTDTVDICRQQIGDTFPEATVSHNERARTLVVHSKSYERPDLQATVAVVTAGTADVSAAGEATVVVEEMGADVTRFDDIGVAGIARLLDRLDQIRTADVVIVAAGREGALPTVVAGLVDMPVIGLPIGSGYGYGGEGHAALASMLQSCSPLAVVNINAGFAAGAQAGNIARAISAARTIE